MRQIRSSKRGSILSLLSMVALVVALTLGVGLHQHATQVHAAEAGSVSGNLVGPKQHYLALGDSLAFGFQPNGDFAHGYVNDLFNALHSKGTADFTNLGCPGESSTTFISGGQCSYSPFSSQLTAAEAYLHTNAGTVSPITLDIGSNDVFLDFTPSTCVVNTAKFKADLDTLNTNLRRTILPGLKAALTSKDHITGDLALMNYYDPFQNVCPNTVPFIQRLNAVLTSDANASGFSIVNVFHAFGGAKTPNANLCSYTWMCTPNTNPPCVYPCPDVHPTNAGYNVIANTFAAALLPH